MTAENQISLLADVPLDISVELDQRILTLREVLELEVGSVVAMRRSAGENIDILIGGVVVAFGEIVIIENTMGVRITDFNTEV
jgi:flagellar motor switch protein FliN/FliY